MNPNDPRDADLQLAFSRPLYLVICPVTGDRKHPYEPVVHEFSSGTVGLTTSFDDELIPILPAIWYALHLPKTRFDTLDLPLAGIRESMKEKRRHLILPVAPDILEDPDFLATVTGYGEPMLIICSDEHLSAASAITRAAGFVLPPVGVHELSENSLKSHWQAMNTHWSADWPPGMAFDLTPPKWTSEIPNIGSAVPLNRLLKALGHEGVDHQDRSASSDQEALHLLKLRAWTNALSRLEERGFNLHEAEDHIEATLEVELRKLRVPLTLSTPGTAPRYRRHVRQFSSRDADIPGGNASSLAEGAVRPTVAVREGDPPEVLSLMVAHNAAGDDSLGLVISDPVPDEAFIALAMLEQHWIQGVQPKKEERLRTRLDAAMKHFWTDSMVSAVRSSSYIDAFTNFPIGLLRMPGHTAPLAALVPIAYRPINPLTRAFQYEFTPDYGIDLSKGMRVLVIECIPESDPVGRASRDYWASSAEQLTDATRSVFVDLAEASSVKEFRDSVMAFQPDVLVISAHGIYDADSNMAGIRIGHESSVGFDLGPMPPMVILSACHSGPRGAGPVSVSDLLLRAGARAVLSTLVPVGVHHNSAFMMRFLVYMSEAIGGTEDHENVLEVWHRVQTNTVILDILYGNEKLAMWGGSTERGTSPLVEFMSGRSRGRIRSSHLYEDAEAVLLEIAAEHGKEEEVRGWLRDPGYAPESMMYTFVGDPSCIRLQGR